mgnify:CR=1 FL=1
MMAKEKVVLTEKERLLVEENLSLVGFVLKQYFPAYNSGIIYDVEDLRQEGMYALCLAAIDFDESRGLFSTYAVSRIRFAILSEITMSRANLEKDKSREVVLSDAMEHWLESRDYTEKIEGVNVRLDIKAFIEGAIAKAKKEGPNSIVKGIELILTAALQDVPYTACTRELGIKENSARTYVARARRFLQDYAVQVNFEM